MIRWLASGVATFHPLQVTAVLRNKLDFVDTASLQEFSIRRNPSPFWALGMLSGEKRKKEKKLSWGTIHVSILWTCLLLFTTVINLIQLLCKAYICQDTLYTLNKCIFFLRKYFSWLVWSWNLALTKLELLKEEKNIFFSNVPEG